MRKGGAPGICALLNELEIVKLLQLPAAANTVGVESVINTDNVELFN